YWIPLQNVAEVTLEPPVDLRDQVWMPANFTWTNGGEAIGFIPTRYPGSAAAEDRLLALARRTEWVPHGPEAAGWVTGLGQRMFTVGETEVALMDMRRLVFDAPPAA
ncbi:MAG: virulence protein SciE type, partial [Oxalobacteraceae bacterium]